MSKLACGHTKKHHLKRGCDAGLRPIDARAAMALGLIPDERSPRQRFDDETTFWAASVKYQR